MDILKKENHDSKKVYKSALLGSYYGIFNVFYVFIPFLTFLETNKTLLTVYGILSVLVLASYIFVPLFFRNEYTYNINKLRYLAFLGIYTLVFYAGLGISIHRRLNFSFFSWDTYFMILYIIISIMSSFDILSSVAKGLDSVRRFYTRTYKQLIFINILVILGGIITGIALILPLRFI